MRYSLAVLLYGLIFSVPGWAVAVAYAGEPAMLAGLAAGALAYAPFVTTACFPRAVKAALAHDH